MLESPAGPSPVLARYMQSLSGGFLERVGMPTSVTAGLDDGASIDQDSRDAPQQRSPTCTTKRGR